MRTVKTTAVVTAEHTVTVQLPADFPVGLCTVVVAERPVALVPIDISGLELDLPFHNPGPWPAGFTVSREQIYDDDGR